jgi:hypothetical protein
MLGYYGVNPLGAIYYPRKIVILAESGNGLDSLLLSNVFSIVDSGTGTDSVIASVLVAIAESGVGNDALTTSAVLTIAENGSVVTALDLTNAFTIAEIANGVDGIIVIATNKIVTITEQGRAVFNIQENVSLELFDGAVVVEKIGGTMWRFDTKSGSWQVDTKTGNWVLLSDNHEEWQ